MRRVQPHAGAQADQEGELLSPEVWLQRIRDLRAKGDLAQAEASLRAFRRHHRDYPLPADLPAPAGAVP
jgi:hypothetical protein